MSSRLIPPKVGAMALTVSTKRSVSVASNFDIEGIDVCEYLEKHAFTLHDRLAGQSPDVAQSQDCRAVGDDGDQIAFARIL